MESFRKAHRELQKEAYRELINTGGKKKEDKINSAGKIFVAYVCIIMTQLLIVEADLVILGTF